MKKGIDLQTIQTEEIFSLVLDVEGHSISTTELIEYLSNMSQVFQSLNHSLNKSYAIGYDQVCIDVVAFEKGSFKIKTKLKKLSKHPLFVAIVGGIVVSMFDNISNQDKPLNVYINNGVQIEISLNELKQNKELVHAISNLAKTSVNSSEVKALTFEYATQQNETARKTIENESLRHLIVPIEEEADKTTHMWTNARLVVVSPVLDSTPAAWKLKLEGRVISAKMTDQDFLSKMDKEKIAFAKNDILIADLETIVTKKEDGRNDVKYFVRKVRVYPKYTSSNNKIIEQKLL